MSYDRAEIRLAYIEFQERLQLHIKDENKEAVNRLLQEFYTVICPPIYSTPEISDEELMESICVLVQTPLTVDASTLTLDHT